MNSGNPFRLLPQHRSGPCSWTQLLDSANDDFACETSRAVRRRPVRALDSPTGPPIGGRGFLATLAVALTIVLTVTAVAASAAETASGRQLAHSTAKGNCLACHRMPNDPTATTSTDIGPPLLGMQARFPERARLVEQIWDASRTNPGTVMPPFGRNGVLTRDEIERIVDYLYTQ